jgi:4'-phosphopantetheinyl transferase
VALSTGADAALGVDCEWIRPRANLPTIARRLFEPATVAALEAAPESERLERFHIAWTALEADVKCDGRGLFRPASARNRRLPRSPISSRRRATSLLSRVPELPPPVDTWRMLEFYD